MNKLCIYLNNVAVWIFALVLLCNVIPFIHYAAILTGYPICILLAIIGVLTVIAGIIGFFALQNEDLKSVTCYGITIVSLAIPKMFCGIYLAIVQHTWDESLEKAFTKEIEHFGKLIQGYDGGSYRPNLTYIQTMYECCGWESMEDYDEDKPLPISCCRNNPSECTQKLAFLNGCKYSIVVPVKVAGVAIVVLCFISVALEITSGLFVVAKAKHDFD